MALLEVAAGAVIGGAVSLATSYLFELRREKLAERQAARLLREELTVWEAILEVIEGTPAGENVIWHGGPPTESWSTHREALARNAAVWEPVADAYVGLFFLGRALGEEDEKQYDEVDQEFVRGVLVEVRAALQALDPYVPPRTSPPVAV